MNAPINNISVQGETVMITSSNPFSVRGKRNIGGIARTGIAKIRNNEIVENWKLNIREPSIFSILTDGMEIYVGGDFSIVNGTTKNSIAKFSNSGVLDVSWNTDTGGTVLDMDFDNNNIYIGGNFSSFGGETRNNLAKVSKVGALDMAWNPNVNNQVKTLIIDGNELYIGGDFSSIGGNSQLFVAKIQSNGNLDGTWNPNVNGTVNDLSINESFVYLGGAFTNINGDFNFRSLARITKSNNVDFSWQPSASNINSIYATSSKVYIGGDFNTINSINQRLIARIGTDGTLDALWNPNIVGSSVKDLLLKEDSIYLVGVFNEVDGQSVYNATLLPTSVISTWNGSWSPSTPTSSDNAIIDANYTGPSFSCTNLTINATRTLTINSGISVTVAGDLTNNGSIIVESGGAFIQTNSTPSNSGAGTYSVNRLADNDNAVYNYFSSPVIGETASDVFGGTGKNFYSFDASIQDWVSLNTASILNAGQGFTAVGTGDNAMITRTFTSNTGFNSGDIAVGVVTGGAGDDDNLIGNPYPSGLDFASFRASNSANIGTTAYLWDSDGSDFGGAGTDYATLTSAGIAGGAGGTNSASPTVAVGQGFFVDALNSATITFSNSHRVTDGIFYRKKELERVWISAAHESGASNQILVAFGEDANEKSDVYDGIKRSSSKVISFYMPVADFKKGVESEKLAIQGLPNFEQGRIVELGIEAKKAGKFTFALSKIGDFADSQEIYLYDSQTGIETDLRKEAATVDLEIGEYNDRFTLRFIGGKITSISDELANSGISIHSFANNIQINFAQSTKAQIAVYDLQGRLVASQRTVAPSNQNKEQVNLSLNETGIFIVKVENANGVLTKKVYLE